MLLGGQALKIFLLLPQTPKEGAQLMQRESRGISVVAEKGEHLGRQPGALPAVSPVSVPGMKESRNTSSGTRHLKFQ